MKKWNKLTVKEKPINSKENFQGGRQGFERYRVSDSKTRIKLLSKKTKKERKYYFSKVLETDRKSYKVYCKET